jgi:hypothetical protein
MVLLFVKMNYGYQGGQEALNTGLRYGLYTTLLWVHLSRITDYKTENDTQQSQEN